ncbi:MAG: hypothetical protein GY851_10210, partial [bacterium]|nr:hypothetical protein [bacterium]
MMNLVLVVNAVMMLAAPADADFVVAPNGNDAHPGTVEQPFATIAKAQEAVRTRVSAGLDKDLVVLLRAGTYRLDAPLAFGPEDGGTDDHGITYAAWPDEAVVVSGGRVIEGWTQQDDGRWTTTVAGAKNGAWQFRQLFADGARLPRGRFPNAPDLLRVDSVSKDVKTITLKTVPFDGNLAGKDAELVMYQNWSISR